MIHKVYEPQIRARLETVAQFCEVVVLELRTGERRCRKLLAVGARKDLTDKDGLLPEELAMTAGRKITAGTFFFFIALEPKVE